ncbi:hypothetical protein PZ895_07845 [Mesorhizobium sp. YIM 152430]|uniref:hypothetical protein n=1 Tax=Mesorhizobium sp. YIM 152430 TaxID=3031761 RepID=UPI0023DC9BDA|nr:hypothetical protein [Mesorhizobium sp. YIM 152430]MDF1599687.1 hypothetical protein [Mesorhizobium sp. YIM 152430]
MTRLSDLSTAQIRMMIKLDDGFDHEDSVGRELNYFIGHEQRTVDSLVDMGLVELVPGRGMQFWFRLTEKGRKVREEGEA